MMKKWISLLLVALMLFLTIPCAMAEGGDGGDPAPAGESGDPTPTATAGNSDPTPTATAGNSDPTPTPTPTAGNSDPTPTPTPVGSDDPALVVPTLTAHGGTFPYDGKAHTVTYTLENGEEYKNVYFSVDGGETWTKTAPSLTKVGKLTVTVRAVKEGGKDPLTVQVKLEVTEAAVDGSIVTIVNCNTAVNVREKASSSSRKLGEARKGKTFKLLAVEGNWYKIQYTSEKVGYVFHTYVKVGKGGEVTVIDTATVVNAPNGVNIRARASSSSSSKILGEAHNGDTFQVTGKSGNWIQVIYNGGTAYIFRDYLKLSSGGSTPDPQPTGKTGVIVNVKTGVNIRTRPSSSSRSLGKAVNGDTFTVLGKTGHWVKVSYTNGVAYIYDRYIKYSGSTPGTDPVTPVDNEKAYIANCNTRVNVRKKASSSSTKLGTLDKGTELTVTGTVGNWTRIKYKGGEAYVFSKYVSYTKPESVVGKTATVVNCNYCVNVRARASSSSKKLGTADKGSTWKVLGISGNWVKVDYDGETAFIYKRYVKIG